MHPLALFAALVSAATPAAAKTKIAVMPLAAQRVDAAIVDVLSDILTVEVGNLGDYEVISSKEINALLGMEKMQTALGCDDVACAAEIGGALGAPLMLSGSVGRLGSTLNINLTLFDTQAMEVKERVRQAVATREDLYEDAMLTAIANLFGASVRSSAHITEPSAHAATTIQPAGSADRPPELTPGWSSTAYVLSYIMGASTLGLALLSDLTIYEDSGIASPAFGAACTLVVAAGVPVVYAGGASARSTGETMGSPGLRVSAWTAYAAALAAAAATFIYRTAGGEAPYVAVVPGALGTLSFVLMGLDARVSHQEVTDLFAAAPHDAPALSWSPLLVPVRYRNGKIGSALGLSFAY